MCATLLNRYSQKCVLKRDGSDHNLYVCLFVCLLKFVKSFAVWQHLAASRGLSYRHQYTFVSGMLNVEKNNWCPMAEQAINLIYRLAEHPDVICADIIKKQAAALLPPKSEAAGGL